MVGRYQSCYTTYALSDSEQLVSGLATEALGAVVTRLFEDHGLHRVFAQADDRNLPVHRLLERLGFRREARLVEADWFKGEWTALRIYACLRHEWRASP